MENNSDKNKTGTIFNVLSLSNEARKEIANV